MQWTCSSNWKASRHLGEARTRRPAYGLATGLIVLLSLLPGQVLGQQRTVQVISRDGFALSAEYYAPAQPGPGILLLHQCDRRGPMTGYEALYGLYRKPL